MEDLLAPNTHEETNNDSAPLTTTTTSAAAVSAAAVSAAVNNNKSTLQSNVKGRSTPETQSRTSLEETRSSSSSSSSCSPKSVDKQPPQPRNKKSSDQPTSAAAPTTTTRETFHDEPTTTPTRANPPPLPPVVRPKPAAPKTKTKTKTKPTNNDKSEEEGDKTDTHHDSSDSSSQVSIDYECEAYCQDFYDRQKQQKRRRRRLRGTGAASRMLSQQNPSNWSRTCQWILVGLVVQLFTLAVLLIVYMALEKNLDHHTTTVTLPPGTTFTSTAAGPGASSSYGFSTPTATTTTTTTESVAMVVTLDPPPDEIYQICAPLAIDQSEAKRKACRAMCNAALCCHVSYLHPESCWKENIASCKAYHEPCAVLEDDYYTASESPDWRVFPNAVDLWDQPILLPVAPDLLTETCNAARVWGGNQWTSEETNGATMTCHEICHAAQCCWDVSLTKPEDRCWTHQHCRPYADACNPLLLSSVEMEDVIQDQMETLPPAPWNISSYCNADKIRTNLDDLLACQQVCQQAECCWNSALLVDHQCGSQTSANCDGYEFTCAVLNFPFDPTTGSDGASAGWGVPDVSVVVEHDNTNDSDQVSDVNVVVSHPEDTSATSFNNDNQNASSYVVSASTIRDLCWNHDNTIDIERGRTTLCEQVCQAGSCCLEKPTDDTSTNACPSYLPPDFCDKYAPCSILKDPASPDMVTRVETACSNLNDLSDCVQVCAAGTCCFTNNPWRACAATNQDIHCSDYTACEVLYQGIATTSSSTSTTATTTTTDQNGNGRRHNRHLRKSNKTIRVERQLASR